jgi:hypothetical protein
LITFICSNYDPIWYDHIPRQLSPNWPILTPEDKLAGLFESHAKLLELNVWTTGSITKSSWD